MSTIYGGPVYWTGGSGVYYKVGIRWSQSPATVTASTGLVTVKAEILFRTHYLRVDDPLVRLSWSGSFGSGSRDIAVRYMPSTNLPWAQTSPVIVHTLTRRVTASEARAITSSLSVTMSGVAQTSGTGRASGTWETARKPVSIQAPSQPENITTSLSSGVRVSTSWARTSTTAAPWQRVVVERWSASTGVYTRVADLGGSATSFTETLIGGDRYRHRIGVFNTAGGSGWALAPFVYTKPAPPQGVRLRKSGPDVVVSWTPPASPASSNYRLEYRVQAREVGTLWADGTDVDVTGTSWTFTAPDPSKAWEFAVQAIGRNPESVDARSDFAYSGQIKLAAPPNPPTGLTPADGEGFVSGTAIRLGWVHNPADGSDQQSAELRWRPAGTSTWSTATVTGTAQTYTVGALAAEKTWEWQVRTKGEHPDWSPWASGALGVSARPAVKITTTPSSWWGGSNTLTVRWTYTDPAGDPSSRYDLTLTDTTTGDVVERIVNQSSGTQSGFTNARSHPVKDGHTYKAEVRVADSYGVWSEWDTAEVTVVYPLPPAPSVDATWQDDDGTVTITATAPAPSGDQVPAVQVDILRYVGNGGWEVIATGDGTTVTVVDDVPTYGDGTHNLYLARTRSDQPSTAVSGLVALAARPDPEQQWTWVSSTVDPTLRCRMRGNPEFSATTGLARELIQFYGHSRPVEFTGIQVGQTVEVSGVLDKEASTWREWEHLFSQPGTMVIRTPDGRRLTASVSDLQVGRYGGGGAVPHGYDHKTVSFSATAVHETAPEVETGLLPLLAIAAGGTNLWQAIDGDGTRFERAGVNLWAAHPAEGAHISLAPAGTNLWKVVDWDNPEGSRRV